MTRSIANRQRSERLEISVPADCHAPWGSVKRVKLLDISPEGCPAIASSSAPHRCLGLPGQCAGWTVAAQALDSTIRFTERSWTASNATSRTS